MKDVQPNPADDKAHAANVESRFETVTCTHCHRQESTLLHTLADYLYQVPGEFAIRACDACGLLFLSPRPVAGALADYYPDAYAPYRPAIQDEPNALMRFMRRRRVRKRRHFVEAASSSNPGRLLDIGASTGIFLDEMRSNGWQVMGIELSESAASYARERFGLTVICAEFSQAELPSGHFDAVTMWDVLEHTYDPADVLKQVWQKLDDGGIVIIAIPSWESLDRRLFGRYWVGFDAPRHLHVFPRPVIEALLTEAGFEVVQNRTTFGGYFNFVTSLRVWLRAHLPPGPLRKGIEKVMDIHGIRLLFEPFFIIMDWLGWGGERVVVARKPARSTTKQ